MGGGGYYSHLGEHGVELFVGAAVAALGEVGLDLLPNLLLVQVPAVLGVRAGPGRGVRSACHEVRSGQVTGAGRRVRSAWNEVGSGQVTGAGGRVGIVWNKVRSGEDISASLQVGVRSGQLKTDKELIFGELSPPPS